MLGKLADTCVVHLTPDIISLAVSSTASSGVQVWADVPQRAHFLEYRIESRAEGNRITFFATVENLQRALKSASAPQVARTQVKLTRRVQGGPTLTFEITLLDSNVRRDLAASRARPADRDRIGRAPQVLVSHDVPLRIVQDAEVSPRRPLSRLPPPSTRRARPAQELHSYTEPAFRDDTATLSIVLGPPDLRALKNVVERMKVFSDYVQLHACEKGGSGPASESAQLQLAVEKDHLVTITTTFAKLVRFRPGQEHAIVVDPAASRCSTCAPSTGAQSQQLSEAEAKVELKLLAKVLNGIVGSEIRMHNSICCVVPGRVVLLKVFLPSLGSDDQRLRASVVFYLPVHYCD